MHVNLVDDLTHDSNTCSLVHTLTLFDCLCVQANLIDSLPCTPTVFRNAWTPACCAFDNLLGAAIFHPKIQHLTLNLNNLKIYYSYWEKSFYKLVSKPLNLLTSKFLPYTSCWSPDMLNPLQHAQIAPKQHKSWNSFNFQASIFKDFFSATLNHHLNSPSFEFSQEIWSLHRRKMIEILHPSSPIYRPQNNVLQSTFLPFVDHLT